MQLVDYLEQNNLLSFNQFGFRRNTSVENQLLFTYGEVTQMDDDGFMVDVVFLDLSKAFDDVSHFIVLLKRYFLQTGLQNICCIDVCRLRSQVN